MTSDPFAEWHIDERDYPANGTAGEKLRFLARYAILAPSGHNTQPWLFRIADDHLDLLADRARALAIVDPHDRALVISCGAALGVLRAAMRHFGHAGDIELLPDGDDPDLLARVRLGPARAPDGEDEALFGAIPQRRSTRLDFASEELPAGLADSLVPLARSDGVELSVLTDPDRKAAVATLVGEGDRAQFADPAFRNELAEWVHSRRARSRDGISGANFGMPDRLSPVGGLVIRTFDMGERVSASDEARTMAAPALLAIATAGDRPRNWLQAGMAHAGILLAVTAAGLTAAYFNQPIEVDRLRPRLRRAAGLDGVPQLLLRIGRGPEIEPAVRRPVAEVTVA